MTNFIIKSIKSLVLAIIISFAFVFIFSFLIGSEGMVSLIIGMSIIFTLIFCTYTILDAIKKSEEK